MRAEPTAEERAAFEIVKRELDVDVDVSREQQAPNQVDAILHHQAGDRPPAALEVSALRNRATVQLERALSDRRHRVHVPGLQCWWAVDIPPTVHLKALERHIPSVLRTFEARGNLSPGMIFPYLTPESPDMRWYAANRVSAHGFANVDPDNAEGVRAPGTVVITLKPVAGWSPSVEIIPEWISGELHSSKLLQTKLGKLQRSGCAEQHLFLWVDYDGVPVEFFNVLDSGSVPSDPADLASITHLWLFPRTNFSSSFLLWAVDGWRRVPVDLRPPLANDTLGSTNTTTSDGS
jgi:hypothetical protein